MVARQATATPDAVAVVAASDRLTYGDLDRRADQLAYRLRTAGVRAESVVGVCLDRGVDLLVAVLGVLKAGAAVLPLAPEVPARLRLMVEDARAQLVLTDRRSAPMVSGAPTMFVETAGFPRHSVRPDADHPAYVAYTSGSTGRPKGVVITHAGIANRVRWGVEHCGLSARDRFLQKTTIGFDAAMWELFGPLVSGGTVVMAPPGAERDPRQLMRAVRTYGVTVLQVVPSMLALLVDEPEMSDLRLVLSAGEPLPIGLADRVGTKLHNTYGPTECSIDATAWVYRQGEPGPYAPIGTPIDNMRVLVLDEDGNPASTGELYLGGVGLARGYVHQPALTAASFVPDPWPATPGDRLYRTGDRVRWTDRGVLEFLGRTDRQIKIRGVRVEAGEVEAVLTAHPDVRAAIVVQRDERLVAYVVGATDLRAHASAHLPAAMVPALFVPLPAIPVLPNGKVDMAALPPAVTGAQDVGRPLGTVEQRVARVWADVLGVEVGAHDHFLALGGHSLHAARVAARLGRDLGRDVPVGAVLDHPTVARLAATLAEYPMAARPPIRPVPRDPAPPLSYGQWRQLFLDQLHPGRPDYVIPVVLRLRGGVDVDALRRALREIVARHEILRTRYVDGVPVVDPPGRWDVGDAVDVDGVGSRPFELDREPPVRAHMARCAPDDHVLVVEFHHIASDAWSMDVFAGELCELYRAFRARRPTPLPPLVVQYADFAAWQRTLPLDLSVDYWRRRLAGLGRLHLPTDRPRRPEPHGRVAEVVTVDVPVEVGRAVLDIGRARGATPFMTLLAAFTALLARCDGQEDIPVGVPTAGRGHVDTEANIGLFVDTLVLRTDVSGNPSFTELLDRVRRTATAAYAHADLPFERLVQELRPVRDPDENPLVQTLFDVRTGPTKFTLDGVDVTELPAGREWALIDLRLTVYAPPDNALVVRFEAAAALFDRATVARLAGDYVRLLTDVVADPTAPVVS